MVILIIAYGDKISQIATNECEVKNQAYYANKLVVDII